MEAGQTRYAAQGGAANEGYEGIERERCTPYRNQTFGMTQRIASKKFTGIPTGYRQTGRGTANPASGSPEIR